MRQHCLFFLVSGCWLNSTSPSLNDGEVHVPSGFYTVGCTEVALCKGSFSAQRDIAIQPGHKAFVRSFGILKYGVTDRDVRVCVANSGCSGSFPDDDFLAVTDIGHARKYCEWRKMRLPTEDEWEAAARGPEGNTFPWGDRDEPNRLLPLEAVLEDSHGERLRYRSRTRPENISPFGVYEMVGSEPEFVEAKRVLSHGVLTKGNSSLRAPDSVFHTTFFAEYRNRDVEASFRCVKDE